VSATSPEPPTPPAPPPLPTLQAVLFDMDGLLVDTEPLWYEVESGVMSSLGGRWREEDQAACLGGTLAATADYMLRGSAGRLPPAEVADRLLVGMAERLRGGVELRPGARRLLDGLAEAGVRTGLVSSSYRRLVDAVLDQLAEAFAVTVAGDEVAHNKPDPEAYLTAAAALGADPATCVVLEDSPTGAAAGVAAGCPTVLVPSVPGLAPPGEWLVIESLERVDVALLRRHVADPSALSTSVATP